MGNENVVSGNVGTETLNVTSTGYVSETCSRRSWEVEAAVKLAIVSLIPRPLSW